jgi:hypothetical protein
LIALKELYDIMKLREMNMGIKGKYICPICGYDGLEEPPYSEDGEPSFEICDCCGNEFGYDDIACGKTIEDLRRKWQEKPKSRRFREQLKNLEIVDKKMEEKIERNSNNQ